MDDRLLLTVATQRRLNLEGEADGDLGPCRPALWVAVLQTENAGVQIIESAHNWVNPIELERPRPTENQFVWADALVKLLNKYVNHDGSWLIAFTHQPDFADMVSVNPTLTWRRIIFLWLDKDGDAQFAIEITDPWSTTMSAPPDHWIEECETAHSKWNDIMRQTFEKQDKQMTYCEAQGEEAPSLKG